MDQTLRILTMKPGTSRGDNDLDGWGLWSLSTGFRGEAT